MVIFQGSYGLALLCHEKQTYSQRETDMLRQRWTMFREPTGLATDQLAFFLQEITIQRCH
jgi:hypothetical protein